jgi:hypothetical protein
MNLRKKTIPSYKTETILITAIKIRMRQKQNSIKRGQIFDPGTLNSCSGADPMWFGGRGYVPL